MKRVLLMILDGWGVGKHDHSDAIGSTPTPNITELASNNPRALLYTSGENVGLPDGQMGNSEVGHLNIGAGRVVYQDLVKINRACRDHSIAQNPEIVKAFNYAKENGKQVHFMGLDREDLCSLLYGWSGHGPEEWKGFYRGVTEPHETIHG